MSKKDYQAIAAALYRTRGGLVTGPSAEQWRKAQWNDDMLAVMNALAEGNKRFDPERFIQACETGRCKGMRPVAA